MSRPFDVATIGDCGVDLIVSGEEVLRRLPPLLETVGADLAVLGGGDAVAAGAETVVDGAKGLQEPLGVPRRFEPLEHALSWAHRAVGVLRPVVEPLVPSMLGEREHPPEGGG